MWLQDLGRNLRLFRRFHFRTSEEICSGEMGLDLQGSLCLLVSLERLSSRNLGIHISG